MIFDTTMDTTMNLIVSMVPQSLSRYRNDAGITSKVTKSYKAISILYHRELDLTRTSIIVVSTNAEVKKVQG